MRKKVLIISFSELHKDPRVKRQIHFLSENYEITAIGYSDPCLPGVSFKPIVRHTKSFWHKGIAALRLLSRRFEAYYWQHPAVKQTALLLENIHADIIIANDIDTLPLALKYAKAAKVIWDGHEYAPCEFDDMWLWRLFYKKYKTYLCDTYLHQAIASLTVAEGIAEKYKQIFGISPQVLTNAPKREELIPSVTLDNKIRMVCHGAALPSRQLETMIDMFEHLDARFTLDFILMPSSKSYLEKLKNMAVKYPNIRFCPPVPMEAISKHLNTYDIGIYLLPPSNFNNEHALPNKLFEFIQARLCVAIGPSPEMANIVQKYQCGIVAKTFTAKDLASQLMQINAHDIDLYKQNAHAAAQQLCAENNQNILLSLIKQVMK